MAKWKSQLIQFNNIMKKYILFVFSSLSCFGLFSDNLKLQKDPKITELIIVIDHKGGNKTKFDKVNVGNWEEDQFGNKSRKIHCAGNGIMNCCASMAHRPDPTPWDMLIEQQCDGMKSNILDLFIGGQLTGSAHNILVVNDSVLGTVDIVASWSSLDSDKIKIVFRINHD